ncbi:2509_t:CDS:2, partial [Gigaspora rosea]
QLKDKARNEKFRRSRIGIEIGGFNHATVLPKFHGGVFYFSNFLFESTNMSSSSVGGQ